MKQSHYEKEKLWKMSLIIQLDHQIMFLGVYQTHDFGHSFWEETISVSDL